jgi:prepilin-type processing-associated H-X9-DG protein
MPPVYRCPSDEIAAVSQTSYAMVVGPEAISDGPGTTKLDELVAAPYETILVVESAGCGIEWTEPRDLEADQIRFLVNDPVDDGIQSGHPDGANALLCDGSVLFLSAALDSDEVRAMCSTSGWESLDPQAAEAGDSQPADSGEPQADESDAPQAAEADEPKADAPEGPSSLDSKSSPDA